MYGNARYGKLDDIWKWMFVYKNIKKKIFSSFVEKLGMRILGQQTFFESGMCLGLWLDFLYRTPEIVKALFLKISKFLFTITTYFFKDLKLQFLLNLEST